MYKMKKDGEEEKTQRRWRTMCATCSVGQIMYKGSLNAQRLEEKKKIRTKGEQKSTGRINVSFLVYASDERIHRVLDGRGDAG